MHPEPADSPSLSQRPARLTCPQCRQTMEAEAVLCIACGFDCRTGTMSQTLIQDVAAEPELSGWRRAFGWNPPRDKNRAAFSAVLIFGLMFGFWGYFFYAKHLEALQTSLPSTGASTPCLPLAYTESTSLKGRVKFTFDYIYFANGKKFSGTREIDASELSLVKAPPESSVLKVFYDPQNPRVHIVQGLYLRPVTYFIYLVLGFIMIGVLWWQFFYPLNDHESPPDDA